MTCKIVSDSSCDLRMSGFDGGSVLFETVPLRIQVGEREFLDNDALDIPLLLGAMAQEKSAASTACPSPAAFAKSFEEADRSICFTISANLSGTYNAAVMGRELALEEHPEKEICVIDSKATAGAMILLIRRAKELLEAGGDPAPLPGHPRQRRRHAPGHHPRGGQGPGGTENLSGHHRPDGGEQGLHRGGGHPLPLREPARGHEAEGADSPGPAGEERGDLPLPGPHQLLRHGEGADYRVLSPFRL